MNRLDPPVIAWRHEGYLKNHGADVTRDQQQALGRIDYAARRLIAVTLEAVSAGTDVELETRSLAVPEDGNGWRAVFARTPDGGASTLALTKQLRISMEEASLTLQAIKRVKEGLAEPNDALALMLHLAEREGFQDPYSLLLDASPLLNSVDPDSSEEYTAPPGARILAVPDRIVPAFTLAS